MINKRISVGLAVLSATARRFVGMRWVKFTGAMTANRMF